MRSRLSLALLALPLLTPQAFSAVTIVHTNDVLGELEPCGCRSNPLGGVVRKELFLKRLGPVSSLLQLDAGDFLFSTNVIPPLLQDQAELQAKRLLQAHDLLKHDAIVPGEKDFALGVKKFEELLRGSKIRFLAANLAKKKGGKLLPASHVFEKTDTDGKKVRIAVIGLVDESLPWPKELKATSATEAAKREVARLRKSADYVVALTHLGYDRDEKLAKQVKGIDLVIGGHSQSFLQKPKREGATLILQSSFRNQYVGAMPLSKPLDESRYQLVGLDTGFDPTAENPSATQPIVQQLKTEIAELNTRASAQQAQASSVTATGGTVKFQTFPKCAECHLKQFEFWKGTQHSKAFHTLVEQGQDMNKECLSCHTVGLGDAQGFSDVTRLAEDKDGAPISHEDLNSFLEKMRKSKLDDEIKLRKADEKPVKITVSLNLLRKSWTPVQCENCHAPGHEHPFGGTYSKKVETQSCLSCHTKERAPEWFTSAGQPDMAKIEKKRASIACPAGELPASEP